MAFGKIKSSGQGIPSHLPEIIQRLEETTNLTCLSITSKFYDATKPDKADLLDVREGEVDRKWALQGFKLPAEISVIENQNNTFLIRIP